MIMTSDDTLLNDDVVEELKDDPAIESSRIAIAVHNGVVTLRESLPSYWQKIQAEKSVRRVMGVRVQSWIEDEAARHASWSVPGVTDVEDLSSSDNPMGCTELAAPLDFLRARAEADLVFYSAEAPARKRNR